MLYLKICKKTFYHLNQHLFKLIVYSLVLLNTPVWAQKQKISFKDTLDQKLDLSEWVIKAKGFIPVGSIITEPALGGFGMSAFALWMQPNTPYIDTIRNEVIKSRAKPNLLALGGVYTANNSWGTFGASIGVIKKWRSNYRLMTGLMDMNLQFYREFETIGEQSFLFNIQMIPITGQLIKQFGTSNWFAGLNYSWQHIKFLRSNSDFLSPSEQTAVISRPGFVLEYDSRDNVFTPDKGFRWNTLLTTSAPWLGSDYSFESLNSALYWYLLVFPNLIAGFRTEYQYLWGEAPFYLLPYIDLRGIPAMRYQGNTISVVETEWRWDFTYRFSALAFGGAGKAIASDKTWNETSWQPSGGMGFRYLLVRQLKLRAGVDIAKSSEQWAYYIVLGTSWIR